MAALDAMILLTPTKTEAQALLIAPTLFRGWKVCAEALPPAILLERAVAAEDGGWTMPRLDGDRATGEIVGSGAFKSAPKERRIELGYGVAPTRRGRGFATTGARLLVEEAFSSGLVNEVWAEASPRNIASQRVLEKAGFTREGTGHDDEEGPVDRWVRRIPAIRPPSGF